MCMLYAHVLFVHVVLLYTHDCICIALQQMLVTVSEQCDQKVMALRDQEKQGEGCPPGD